uniref:Ankyrin repeat domain 63 n=1 Tax=Fundulus heteroclitus TaxID=8078 RepID=A0A3Q2UKB4_FUNHE
MMRPKDLRQGSGTKTFLDAMHGGKVHLARFILDALDGRIINSKTENSRTPLMYAVCLQEPGTRIKFTRLLLEKGANVNCQDEDGRTALSHACEMGHLDVIKLLVQFNADPDVSDAWGNSALMYAAFSGHSQVLEFLVRAFKRLGLRLDRTNSAGHSAKEIANFFGHNQCVQILNFPCRKSVCKEDPFVDAAKAADPERRLPNRLPRHVLDRFSNPSSTLTHTLSHTHAHGCSGSLHILGFFFFFPLCHVRHNTKRLVSTMTCCLTHTCSFTHTYKTIHSHFRKLK